MKQDEEIDRLLGEIPLGETMAAESPPSFYRATSSTPPPPPPPPIDHLSSSLWGMSFSDQDDHHQHRPLPSRQLRYPDNDSGFSLPPGAADTGSFPPFALAPPDFRLPPQWSTRSYDEAEAFRYILIQQQLQQQRELMRETYARAVAARSSFLHKQQRNVDQRDLHQRELYQYQVPGMGMWSKPGYRSATLLAEGAQVATTSAVRSSGDPVIEYTSVESLRGRIVETARDQHGCRFLQRKFSEGTADELKLIFREIIDHVESLMVDAFGNYLMQKVLEHCDEYQRMQILMVVTQERKLVEISMDMHGTRAVQKLIETLRTCQQVEMVVGCLKRGIVSLIKDTNGNHVVQRCLARLNREDNKFIFDTMISHIRELAVHRHGCCVLQRCIDAAPDSERCRLIGEVTANALELSQDAYGNYVVQYVLDGYPGSVCGEIMLRLSGKFAELSMQKFSSNVVEKCLGVFPEQSRSAIIRELISSPSFEQLLHHEYGNYVIQSSLSASKGVLHDMLVNAIQPYASALRTSPYGKRIIKTGMAKR